LSRYADRKPATKAAYSIYLRGFLKFLGMEFDFRVKVSHSLPAFIQYEDLEKLKGAIREKATHKRTMFRDLTLIETAMKTGMRRGEIANLQPRHIDFANHRVMVVGGKGAKDRVIPLFPALEPLLMKLCEDKSPNDKVFGLKGSSIGSMFTVWAKKAGVELHAHSMRHYFATTLVERGANIRAVQELLGHTSLSTTQVYIAVTVKHLEHAINLLE
jgi:integrase/recombinase XerD